MWAYYGVVMNQEDMIMISGAAIVGLLLGFLYGKHASRKSQNRNISQKLTQNEIERWRIKPEYSTLLMAKDPIMKAEAEYEKYKVLRKKNDDKIALIQDSVNEYLRSATRMQEEYDKIPSKAGKALFMETNYALWVTRVQEERQRTQNATNQLIAHSCNLEFLDFVRGGSTKPGIVRQMDQLDLETELKNNQKKNWKTIDKLTQSMQSDHIEQFEDFFAIKK